MELPPVSAERIQIAQDFGLENVVDAATACREAGLPFWAACALLQKESMGRNVYGRDEGGALSGFPYDVNLHNFRVFEWLVFDKGNPSNGVGPTQITWSGFFPDMESRGLRPYVPLDNMEYGFALLTLLFKQEGSWEAAAAKYNGSAEYGADFVVKAKEWKRRLGVRGSVE